MNTYELFSKDEEARIGTFWLIVILFILNLAFNTADTFLPTIMSSPIVIQWDFFQYILPVIGLSGLVLVAFTKNVQVALTFWLVFMLAISVLFPVVQYISTILPDTRVYFAIKLSIPGIIGFIFGLYSKDWGHALIGAVVFIIGVLAPTIFLILCWVALLGTVIYTGFEKLKPGYSS